MTSATRMATNKATVQIADSLFSMTHLTEKGVQTQVLIGEAMNRMELETVEARVTTAG